MKKSLLMGVGGLVVLALAGALAWKLWIPQAIAGRYGDWTIKCETKNADTNASSTDGQGQNKESCLMTQLLLSEKGEQQVLAVAVGFWPGKHRPQIAFHTPPDIQKAEGLTLQVDGNAIYKIPVGICTFTRCTALDYIPEEVRPQMLTGRQMIVTYKFPNRDKRIGVLVSLNGFDKALNVLEKRHKELYPAE